MSENNSDFILKVENLSVDFATTAGIRSSERSDFAGYLVDITV